MEIVLVSGNFFAQTPRSLLPLITCSGAMGFSTSRTADLPMSPAWMRRSTPRKASNASGRTKPCVSEISPISSTGFVILHRKDRVTPRGLSSRNVLNALNHRSYIFGSLARRYYVSPPQSRRHFKLDLQSHDVDLARSRVFLPPLTGEGQDRGARIRHSTHPHLLSPVEGEEMEEGARESDAITFKRNRVSWTCC